MIDHHDLVGYCTTGSIGKFGHGRCRGSCSFGQFHLLSTFLITLSTRVTRLDPCSVVCVFDVYGRWIGGFGKSAFDYRYVRRQFDGHLFVVTFCIFSCYTGTGSAALPSFLFVLDGDCRWVDGCRSLWNGVTRVRHPCRILLVVRFIHTTGMNHPVFLSVFVFTLLAPMTCANVLVHGRR